MSAVVINGDTSGSITLQAPAVAGTNTLTLPANTGTVLTTASTFAGTGPTFSAYNSSFQNVTSGVFTKVACNTEEFDTNNCFDSVTNYRFTPNVAGYYLINGAVGYQAATSKVQFLASIYKNGSEFKRGTYLNINTPNNENSNVSSLIYFNGSTDYVELYAYLEGVGTVGFIAGPINTYFQGALVRAA